MGTGKFLRRAPIGTIVHLMVNKQTRLDVVFGALADSTRRGMIGRLAQGPATIGELGAPYSITKAAVTKHIKVLERAGLLERRVEGRTHHCRIEPGALGQAEEWVRQVRAFWEERFDDLADHLAELQGKQPPPRQSPSPSDQEVT